MDVKVPHPTAGADEVARQHYVRLPTPPQFLLARATEEAKKEKGEGDLTDTALPAPGGGPHLLLPDEITLHVLPPLHRLGRPRQRTCHTTHPPTRSRPTGVRLFGRTVAVPCGPDLPALVRSQLAHHVV